MHPLAVVSHLALACNPATILGPVEHFLQRMHNFSYLRAAAFALCSILLSRHRGRSKRGATGGGAGAFEKLLQHCILVFRKAVATVHPSVSKSRCNSAS